MAVFAGSNIVNDGLVFHFDLENGVKSWKGKPTTNLATNTPSMNGWAGQYTLIDSNTKTFLIQTTQDNSATTSAWRTWYWDVSSYIGQTITISGYVKFVSETDATFQHITIGQGNTGSFPYHIAGSLPADKVQVSVKPIEKIKMTWTGTINSTGIVGFTQWINNVIANGGNAVLEISNVQIEVNSFPTPFVNGTRNSANAILDLAGNETFTISDLTYYENNTFDFDGVNDVITVTNSGNYPATWDDPFTLETWIKIPTGATWHHVDGLTTSNAGTVIIGRGAYHGSHGLLRYSNGASKSLRFFMRSDNTYNYVTFLTPEYDTWYHTTGTFDGTNLKLYINGNLVQTTEMIKGSDVPDIGNWRIGGDIAFGGNTGLYGEGEIPIARFYNKALTDTEVKQNFESTRSRYGI